MLRINRTKAVYKILNSEGRMFSVSWKTQGGKERKLNGKLPKVTNKRKNQDKIFGYLTLFDVHTKTHKRVNTRTIRELSIGKQTFHVR